MYFQFYKMKILFKNIILFFMEVMRSVMILPKPAPDQAPWGWQRSLLRQSRLTEAAGTLSSDTSSWQFSVHLVKVALD